jgi:hypothetical protein
MVDVPRAVYSALGLLSLTWVISNAPYSFLLTSTASARYSPAQISEQDTPVKSGGFSVPLVLPRCFPLKFHVFWREPARRRDIGGDDNNTVVFTLFTTAE